MEISEYLVTVVKPMLKHPHYLKVSKSLDSMGVLLTMDTHKEDMGVVIGKKGETAEALRKIIRIVGHLDHSRVSLKINEPQKSD